MATLILTTVGTVLGGPIGGAIGALAGQAVDATIFKPKGREGPRLTDLHVQTSRYGNSIPRVFGTMRVAGTVIWATDLQENSGTSGGGKGQPSVTSYSYSASFAVALSARRIVRVGRIWADGNLLRGAAGDFKTALGAMRVHDGAPGQSVDPLIAADQGTERTPAFGDLAYVVFEDLQLADFGNRIPSLTFELVADSQGISISAMASELMARSVGYVGSGTEPVPLGYSIDGANGQAAFAPLIDAYGLAWRAANKAIDLVDAASTGRNLARDQALRTADDRVIDPNVETRAAIETIPARLSVRHYDPARDYQVGLQSAGRPGPGDRSDELDLPALLSADDARAIAGRKLGAALRSRRGFAGAYDWRALDLLPGDVVTLDEVGGAWQLQSLEWSDMVPRLHLLAHGPAGSGSAGAGDSGRAVLQPDRAQGPTILSFVELPASDGALPTTPQLFAAATGADAGWRRAALFRYDEALGKADPIGSTAARAVSGTSVTALGDGAPWTIDGRNSVDITLDNDADMLLAADDEALMQGANLCALGDELLQFGAVQALANRHFRLSRLLRGWHGSEWAMSGHQTGERFVLIEADRLRQVPALLTDLGATIELRASGVGDETPAEASRQVDGRAVLPPAPVGGEVVAQSNGDLLVRWVRRSRQGWQWADQGDVPIGEEREAYAITVLTGAQTLRSVEVSVSTWTYVAADVAADRAAAGSASISIDIRQIGTYGAGWPLSQSLP